MLNFIFGTIVGAIVTYVVTYLVNIKTAKAIDDRRRDEAIQEEASEFAKVQAKMPRLIEDIRDVLEGDDTIRVFFVVPEPGRVTSNEEFFYLRPNVHPGLLKNLRVLENAGYIEDITPGNAPKYQMTEDFVEHVLNS